MGVCFGIVGCSAAGELGEIEITGTGKGEAGGDEPGDDETEAEVEGVVVVMVMFVVLVLLMLVLVLVLIVAAAGDSAGLGGNGWWEASARMCDPVAAVALPPPKLPPKLPGDADCSELAGVPGRLSLVCPWFPRRIRSTSDGRARSSRGWRPSMHKDLLCALDV